MLQRIRQELKQGKTLLQFGFLKATGQALGMIVPLVVAGFFAEDLYGSYSLAKTVVFFFTTVLIASAQIPFIVFANQEKTQAGKINKAFSIQCSFMALAFGIFLLTVLIFNKFILRFAEINVGDLFFVALAFVGIAVKTFLCNTFMGMGERLKNALVELAFGVLSLGLIFVFYFFSEINLRMVFAVYPISAVAVIAIFIWFIDFGQLLPFKFEKKYFQKMFDFAKWMFIGTTATYFINWGDNWVLRYFKSIVTLGDIGVYNVGYQIFKGLITLTAIVGFYFLPFISQHLSNPEKIKNYLWNKRPKILILATTSIAVLFFLLPFIFNFIYGDTYPGTIGILRVLLLGCLFNLYSTFYHAIYNAANRYKILQIFIVVQAIVKILLDLLLVPVMGLMGAAIATIIAYFLKIVMLELHFSTRIKRILKL